MIEEWDKILPATTRGFALDLWSHSLRTYLTSAAAIVTKLDWYAGLW